MEIKNPTKLEKERKNLELGEMQEEDNHIGSDDYRHEKGYELSEDLDTVDQ